MRRRHVMERAIVECLDKDGYCIGLLVVPCFRERPKSGDHGKAVVCLPSGPKGTAIRLVYLPTYAGGHYSALPADDRKFGVTKTKIAGNKPVHCVFKFPESYLIACFWLDWQRVKDDFIKGSGWQRTTKEVA